jgi:hypothetical protein
LRQRKRDLVRVFGFTCPHVQHNPAIHPREIGNHPVDIELILRCPPVPQVGRFIGIDAACAQASDIESACPHLQQPYQCIDQKAGLVRVARYMIQNVNYSRMVDGVAHELMVNRVELVENFIGRLKAVWKTQISRTEGFDLSIPKTKCS